MLTILGRIPGIDDLAFAPLTATAVKQLEAKLGVRLPIEVVALYKHHGGAERGMLPARLMPPNEVAREQKALESIEWNERVNGRLLFLWTDDQSNYAAVYADGPAKGKVCLIDHGSPSAAPRFGSVGSFYRAMVAAQKRGSDLVDLARPAQRASATRAANPAPKIRRSAAFDPRLTARIARDLQSLPWLSRVGEPRSPRDRAWIVVPERRALAAVDGRAWEHVQLEADSLISVTLSRVNPDAYRNWNKVVGEARRFFARTVTPALKQLDAMRPGWAKARDAIWGSVYAMFAERYYLEQGIEPGFYTRVHEVFASGRVPVGLKVAARAGALDDALARCTGQLLVG